MMEALACHPLGQSLHSLPLYTKLTYPRYYKGANAAFSEKAGSWSETVPLSKIVQRLDRVLGKTSWVLYNGQRDCEKGNSSSLI